MARKSGSVPAREPAGHRLVCESDEDDEDQSEAERNARRIGGSKGTSRRDGDASMDVDADACVPVDEADVDEDIGYGVGAGPRPDVVASSSFQSDQSRHADLMHFLREQSKMLQDVQKTQLAQKKRMVQHEKLQDQRAAFISSELNAIRHQVQRIANRLEGGLGLGFQGTATATAQQLRQQRKKGGQVRRRSDGDYERSYSSAPAETRREDPPEGENVANARHEGGDYTDEERERFPVQTKRSVLHKKSSRSSQSQRHRDGVAATNPRPSKIRGPKSSRFAPIVPFAENPWVIRIKQELENNDTDEIHIKDQNKRKTTLPSPVTNSSAKKQRRVDAPQPQSSDAAAKLASRERDRGMGTGDDGPASVPVAVKPNQPSDNQRERSKSNLPPQAARTQVVARNDPLKSPASNPAPSPSNTTNTVEAPRGRAHSFVTDRSPFKPIAPPTPARNDTLSSDQPCQKPLATRPVPENPRESLNPDITAGVEVAPAVASVSGHAPVDESNGVAGAPKDSRPPAPTIETQTAPTPDAPPDVPPAMSIANANDDDNAEANPAQVSPVSSGTGVAASAADPPIAVAVEIPLTKATLDPGSDPALYTISFPPGPLGLLVSTDPQTRIGCRISNTIPARLKESLSVEDQMKLKAGDRFISVDGAPVIEAKFDDIVRRLGSIDKPRVVVLRSVDD